MMYARFPSLILVLTVSVALICGTGASRPKKDGKDSPTPELKTEEKAKDAKSDAKTPEPKPKRTKSKEPKQPSAVTPSERRDAWWQARVKTVNERAKQGNVDLLFIGDSITQGWEGAGKDVWKKFYGERNAVNLGIGGDRTQHVLWRLDNGNIAGITPKLAVIMIGTNNSGQNSPEDIAAGIKAIVEKLRAKLPETKILVLGVFPRGADAADARRQTNTKANAIASKLADDKNVFYLDIGDKFLDKDGKAVKEAFTPDLLHLSAKGYTIWAEAIEPTVAKLMGEKSEK